MESFSKKIKKGGDDYIDMAAADAVKITNGFLDDTFANVSKKLPNIAGKAGKKDSITSILKFGYSDYLKMFLFLNLCADDDKVVRRVADVIQINVGNGFADTTPLYKHAKGTGFRMKNANTYIEINATVKLRLCFLICPW